jgi:uncharacterized protein YndB with AHSA1/START domain
MSFALLLGLLASSRSSAEVADSSVAGFRVREVALIKSAPTVVYQALVSRIGDWWNSEHTFSGSSRNLSLRDEPGGCFCERLPDGGGVRHLTVVYVSPNRELRLTGAIGPLQTQGVAGSMTWKLTPAEGGTNVELTYSLGGYYPGGLTSMAAAVDGVIGEQLARLKSYVETGKPQAQ